jgi:hypothetical protein
MKKNPTIIFLVVITLVYLLVTVVFSDTHNAASPSYSDVSAAISAASSGDTVMVPEGSATWSSTLGITKDIELIGAGIGNTVISGNNRGQGSYMISFNPGSAGLGLRISGFTFNITEQQCIYLANNNHLPPHADIRIDHNRFTNSTISGAAIFNRGCRGVIDNNTFDNMKYPLRIGWGSSMGGAWDWDNFPELVWGLADDNLYIEDNTFSNVKMCLCDQDQAGRYVFRYNQFNADNTMYPWLDIHGGRGDLHGGFGGEVYGNIYTVGGFLMSHRGGRLAFHHNNASAGGTYNIYNNSGCPPGGDREKINNSYIFINREGPTGSLVGWSNSGGDDCGGVVVENSTFWMDNSGCVYPNTCSNITSGVGCGPLANRPTNCTTGTGYWATNQSCSDLTGMVGTNPATPISGTLYKCTSPNTWTAYYTPLVYPHPLVSGEDPPPPPPPDTTPPGDITSVNDGTGGDVDFTYSTTELSANWTPSTDDESDILKYWYAIGTTAGGTDTAEWTSTSNGTVTSVTRSNLSLTTGVTYYFTVRAENGVSLQSNSKSSDGLAVIEGTDNTPPVISNISATNIIRTGVTITWYTDEPATSQVEYGLSSSYGDVSAEDSNLVTSHSAELSGLTAGTQYHYAVISRDAVGNESSSLDKIFTTEIKEEIDMKAYPNPYSPSKGNSMKFSLDSTGGGEVKIYTISGKLVKELVIQSGESEVDWDVLNEEGNNIKAGLYIYSITDGDGNKKTGKLLITQ